MKRPHRTVRYTATPSATIPSPLLAHHGAPTPGLAATLGALVATLKTLLAARASGNPHPSLLGALFVSYIILTLLRFQRLLASRAAGDLPPTARPASTPSTHLDTAKCVRPDIAPRTQFPTSDAALAPADPSETAALAAQLEQILTRPDLAELLAATPTTNATPPIQSAVQRTPEPPPIRLPAVFAPRPTPKPRRRVKKTA